VQVTEFVFYRNYALHLGKLFRNYSGETLRRLAQEAYAHWRALGCRPDVLKSICEQMLGLDLDRWP